MTPTKKYKIVWAVDPLGEVKSFQTAAAHVLEKLAAGLDAEVYPIYLFGGYPLEFPVYSAPTVPETTRNEMKSALREILTDLKFDHLKELEILVKPYVSLREGVGHLVDRATAIDADLILATTHARKGITRWIIGSFAEALTEKSTIPTLIVNPETTTKWSLDSVIFATDFSSESKRAFREFLPVARALGAEICLYHKLTYMVTPSLVPAFSSESADWKQLMEKRDERRSLAASWALLAERAEVRMTSHIDQLLERSPADAVVSVATERQAWIAIAAQSKPLAAALLGSTARRIIRNSDVPVWVFRSSAEKFYQPDTSISAEDIAEDLRLGKKGD